MANKSSSTWSLRVFDAARGDGRAHGLAGLRPRPNQLPPDKLEAVQGLLEQDEVCRRQLAEQQDQADALLAESSARHRPQIIGTKQIQAETVVRLDDVTCRLKGSYPGLVKAILQNGYVVFTPVRGR